VTFRFGLQGQNQYGGIYKLTPKGIYSSLYLFDGTVGANPVSALIQHTNGLLYGNTQNNGGVNVGTIYSLNIGAGRSAPNRRLPDKLALQLEFSGRGSAQVRWLSLTEQRIPVRIVL